MNWIGLLAFWAVASVVFGVIRAEYVSRYHGEATWPHRIAFLIFAIFGSAFALLVK